MINGENLNMLRDKAYECAKAHGWHDAEYTKSHWLCLVISELMEAVEADRNNRYALITKFNNEVKKNNYVVGSILWVNKFNQYIKDTVQDEMADACIRLMDLAGLYKVDLDKYDYEKGDTHFYYSLTMTESMFLVAESITNCFMIIEIPKILNEIFAFCISRDFDIIQFIELKMAYNETRPYKHNKQY